MQEPLNTFYNLMQEVGIRLNVYYKLDMFSHKIGYTPQYKTCEDLFQHRIHTWACKGQSVLNNSF